jgi:transmembrane sensor
MVNIIKLSGRKNSRHPEIEEQAQAWIIRLDGNPDADDIAEFRAWLNNSPSHSQVFHQYAGTWHDMDRLSALYFTNSTPQQPVAVHRKRPGYLPGPFTGISILASLLLITGVLTLFISHNADNGYRQDIGSSLVYSTAIGEIRTVSLADGSQVQMNSNTKMEVAYSRNSRSVYLAAGEAYFDVAKDADKPFVVYAGRYAVEATGTEFSVEILDGGLDVLVTEGRVEVATLKSSVAGIESIALRQVENTASLVPLVKGQKVVLNERNNMLESIQKIEPEHIEKSLAWRDGMLLFDNDSLEDVIAEINRYTPVKIIISDSRIRDLRFGGYFRISDVLAILATMEENFDIQVDRINDNLVYLSLLQN